jgi:hypothetical protein
MDAQFQRFFEDVFPALLRDAQVPGGGTASWDRRAAWLLYLATVAPHADEPDKPLNPEEMFG